MGLIWHLWGKRIFPVELCGSSLQPYGEKKKSFAARPQHLPNELAACQGDLTKLASLQEMMQGVIVKGWKGQRVSKTLGNDVANGLLMPSDGQRKEKKRTEQTPHTFLPPCDSLRLHSPSDQPTSSHLWAPASHILPRFGFFGGSATPRRAGNSSR